MASTSPYQNNDYQAVSTFRPYRLPINEIFKAVSAQNQFWDQGAARVKSVYDNALGLKLTNATNRQIRDDFMKEAEKQITKLSSMDLSDPSVQRQGVGIFKPLFQDEGIMFDDQSTRHIEKVNQDALNYRTMEGGKYYSATNHQYALLGSKEFKDNPDRFAGKQYMEHAKEYEPFYDPSQEINGILKNCKPDKASNEVTSGYYIKGFSDESLTAEKINTCLDAGLSDRARRQLQINGAITYYNNPAALRDKYLPHLDGTRSALGQRKAAIQGVLANEKNLRNLKPSELQKLGIRDASQITPEFLQGLRDEVTNIDTRISNINDTVGKLSRDDFSPITGDNFEPVASAVYARDYMKNVGEGFSYDWSKNTMKADIAQLTFFKEAQQNARQEDDQQFDREQKILDLQNKLQIAMMTKAKTSGDLAGNLTQDEVTAARTLNVAKGLSSVVTGDSYEQLTTKMAALTGKRSEYNSWLKQQVGADLPSNITSFDSPEGQQWLANYRITAQADPVKKQILDTYDQAMDDNTALHDLYQNVIDVVDKKVSPIEGDFRKSFENDWTNVTINGKKMAIGSQAIYDALTGRGGRIKIDLGSPGTTITGGTAMTGTTYGARSGSITIDGVEIPTTYGTAGNKLWQKAIEIQGKYNKKLNEIKSARNKAIQDESIIQTEGYTFPELNDDKGTFKLTMAQNAKLPSSYLDKMTIGQTNLNGEIVVTFAPAKKGETDYNPEAAIDNLLNLNATANRKVEGDPNSIILTGIPGLDLIDETSLSNMMQPYIRGLERKASTFQSSSTGYIHAGRGAEYRLDITPGLKGGYSYKIIDKSNPTNPVAIYNDRQDALQRFQFLLGRAQADVSTK